MSQRLIGGLGLTYLRIYNQRPGPDGVHAGCAHVHALTDEAYYCLGGIGAVDLHDPVNGYRSIPLRKGIYVQFPPGTLHRSVSYENCEVLALMGDGGLPERGDARIYFGAAADADPARYADLKALAATGLDGALARRDRSAEAYGHLLALWETDPDAYRQELDRFSAVHRTDLATRRDAFKEAVETGAVVQGATDRARLAAAPDIFGMCGVLKRMSGLDDGFLERIIDPIQMP